MTLVYYMQYYTPIFVQEARTLDHRGHAVDTFTVPLRILCWLLHLRPENVPKLARFLAPAGGCTAFVRYRHRGHVSTLVFSNEEISLQSTPLRAFVQDETKRVDVTAEMQQVRSAPTIPDPVDICVYLCHRLNMHIKSPARLTEVSIHPGPQGPVVTPVVTEL